MARPTVTQVYAAAAGHAGDPNGQFFAFTTGSRMETFYKTAYSELFRAMQSMQSPRAKQTNFYDLPAYTSVLDPATANILNLGEIDSIQERGSVTEATISNAVSGTGLVTITATAHGFATGYQIVQYGIGGLTDDVNGLFTISVTNANTYTANGCTATGTYSSGGKAAYSTEGFTDVIPANRNTFPTNSPQTTLLNYDWQGDLIYFPTCSVLRQLKIVYLLSGSAPLTTNAVIPIDDSLDFLAVRAAGLALRARGGNRDKAAELNALAVGINWESRGDPGGFLDQLLGPAVRNLLVQLGGSLRPEAYGGAKFRRDSWIL